MVVLSGYRSGTLSVASEAWNLFWYRSRLVYAESMMESLSGVIKIMQHWNMYLGSLLSVAVGEVRSKRSV